MVWYKCCSAVFVWLWDIFRQKEAGETEEKQSLIDSTLENEPYHTQSRNLLLEAEGTDLIASEDLEHAIVEYANENMINISLREGPMGARENAARARMYQRALQTVKTKLVGFTKPTPSFRNLEPGELFGNCSEWDKEIDYDKKLTMKYGQMLQEAYNEITQFKGFPTCLVLLSHRDNETSQGWNTPMEQVRKDK